MKNNFIVIAIVIVLVGVGAFFGGIKYQKSKSGGVLRQTQNGTGGSNSRAGGQNGQGRFSIAGRPVIGEVLSVDDKSITVKLQDGSSKIVLFSDKTSINKASAGTKGDLKVGERVLATGTENSDGSVSATNLQLNPTFGGMGGRPPNQASKSADAKEIVVEASNYKFTPTSITVKKGEKTRIVLKNTEGSHDFRVDELNISTAIIQGSQEDFVEFTADKAGKYEFYCSVDGHRQMGMKGTFIVE